jgi:hypothetical protein
MDKPLKFSKNYLIVCEAYKIGLKYSVQRFFNNRHLAFIDQEVMTIMRYNIAYEKYLTVSEFTHLLRIDYARGFRYRHPSRLCFEGREPNVNFRKLFMKTILNSHMFVSSLLIRVFAYIQQFHSFQITDERNIFLNT